MLTESERITLLTYKMSDCSYLAVYTYSKLTSKCIINAFSAYLFLKEQFRWKLAAKSQLVHFAHVQTTGY